MLDNSECNYNDFNPRTYKRCDRCAVWCDTYMRISIHAPIRGGTVMSTVTSLFYCISIPAPIRGATSASIALYISTTFQSTHQQGVRHFFVLICCRGRGISIPAPTRGATLETIQAPYLTEISIHTPIRGATSYNRFNNKLRSISIHAPIRGAT
ncbi:hypothetical protein BTJ48_03331 [Bacillus mycoides]|nr:hypothetical protein BTJ48_03331 [Bacillus mycoides]